MLDAVTTDMDVYTDEIFGPVLSVVRRDTGDDAIEVIHANPYGNGTAIFTNSGEAARRFHRRVDVGKVGINVPVPVPMAFYSFGGWKTRCSATGTCMDPRGCRSTLVGRASRDPITRTAPARGCCGRAGPA